MKVPLRNSEGEGIHIDIKGKRIRNDRNIDDSYSGLPDALGSSSCDANINWYARSSSWQGNSNVKYDDIEAEKRENDLRFGVPHDDNVPNPAASNNDTDKTLPNPHNFSSNPGYMGTSTASMLTASAPGTSRYRTAGGGSTPGGTASQMKNSVVGRAPVSRKSSVSMPAPGDTDPRSEGGPQMMTSGFSG